MTMLMFLLYSWFSFYVKGSCYSSIKSDIVFVLDSSDSISWDDWSDLLTFVGDLVQNNLPTDTRVGSLVFGSTTFLEFGLDQYDNAASIANHIETETTKLRGTAQTLLALEAAYNQIFVTDTETGRAKKLLLFTDSRPSSDGDPCEMSTTLKVAGIEVIIVALGDWLDQTNMGCLVNDEDSDMIHVKNVSELQEVATQLQDIICAKGFAFNVIEVQPYPGPRPRFVQIYNGGEEMDAFKVQFQGLYNGSIPVSTLIPQGDVLLVSDDPELSSNCGSGCVFYLWDQLVTNYTKQNNDGTIVEGYSIKLTDSSGDDIADSIWAPDFPKVKPGYSFVLDLVLSNARVASNYHQSCEIGGSPGVLPTFDCGACSNSDECQFQGDTVATCEEEVCKCSDGFYPEGSSCDLLPVPSNCVVHGVPGEEGRYYFEWSQPYFMDLATFSGTKIYYYSTDSIMPSVLVFLDAPPTPSFDIAEDHRDDVQIVSMFVKEGVTYPTKQINCTVMEAPTFSPTRLPTKAPSNIPTVYPSYSTVPAVDECSLRITNNEMTQAVISWEYSGDYIVDGKIKDPTGFLASWGETVTSFSSNTAWPSSEQSVSLIARWNYTKVVAKVTVEGSEDATVFSDPVDCTVYQATPSPVAYPVPAPDDCSALVETGGGIADVTITPPSSPYTPAGVETQVGYLVRVKDKYITNYPLGYDGTVLNQTVIIGNDGVAEISAISLGTETVGSNVIHPESDPTLCTIRTKSPTRMPTAPDAKFPVPAVKSCDVLVGEEIKDYVQVTISWVPPDHGAYNDSGTPLELSGYKYRLGGMTSWVSVAGENTTVWNDIWKVVYAETAKVTYVVAVGNETVGGKSIYPISDQEIPCSVTTHKPTSSPTRSPSSHPTRRPSRSPTSAPTFDIPEVAFVPTDYSTNQVLYSWRESNTEYNTIAIMVNPPGMVPISVQWELIDNVTGLQPTEGFNQTNGTVPIGQYRENYKSSNPGCSQGGTCISSYSCISHLTTDYCVKDIHDKVFDVINIKAYEVSIVHEKARIFKVRIAASGSYNGNEFYGNDQYYTISPDLSEATLDLYDATGPAYCNANPTDPSCRSTNVEERLKWWYWLILVLIILLVILLVWYGYRKHIMAKENRLQKRRLDNELYNELKNQEEDFGVGPQDTVNPLAIKTLHQGASKKKKLEPSRPVQSDDEDIGFENTAFNQKVQFDQM